MRTLIKILAGLALAFAALIVYGNYVASTPEYEARSRERAAIQLCRADLADPSLSRNAKETVVRPVCERKEREFREKWNREP